MRNLNEQLSRMKHLMKLNEEIDDIITADDGTQYKVIAYNVAAKGVGKTEYYIVYKNPGDNEFGREEGTAGSSLYGPYDDEARAKNVIQTIISAKGKEDGITTYDDDALSPGEPMQIEPDLEEKTDIGGHLMVQNTGSKDDKSKTYKVSEAQLSMIKANIREEMEKKA